MKYQYLTNWAVNGTKKDIAVVATHNGISIYKTDSAYYIIDNRDSLTSTDIEKLDALFKTVTLSPDGALELNAYEIPFGDIAVIGVLVGNAFLLYRGNEFYTHFDETTADDVDNIAITEHRRSNQVLPMEKKLSATYFRQPHFDVDFNGNISIYDKNASLNETVDIDGEDTQMEHVISINRVFDENLSSDITAAAHVFKTEDSYLVAYDGWKPTAFKDGTRVKLTSNGRGTTLFRYDLSNPLNIGSDDFQDSYMIHDGKAYYSTKKNQEYTLADDEFCSLINRVPA